MHKKIASELTSLAHGILQIKNKEDVFILKEKAHEIYEKLSVLAYVEQYVNTTPQATQTKEELLSKIEKAESFKEENKEISTKNTEEIQPKVSQNNERIIKEEAVVSDKENSIEQIEESDIELQDLFNQPNENFKEATFIEQTVSPQVQTLEEELKDTISIDVTADMFAKAVPKSLNDKLQKTIQIGLNDRIAFVKHLFNNDSVHFNKVVTHLNTFDSEKEAKKFINKSVKTKYDWDNKEEYETRFIEILERKFL